MQKAKTENGDIHIFTGVVVACMVCV